MLMETIWFRSVIHIWHELMKVRRKSIPHRIFVSRDLTTSLSDFALFLVLHCFSAEF